MKKGEQKFTMMLIPHSGQSTFSFSISLETLKIVGIVLAVIITAATIFSSHFYFTYNKLKAEVDELSTIASDYDNLQQQLEYFMNKTRDLEKKMMIIEQLDNSLRALLKDDPELKDTVTKGENNTVRSIISTLSSRGSLNRRERAIMQLELLEQKIQEQEESLKELKDAVIQRNTRLAHTPSIYPVSGRITSRFGYRKSPFGSGIEFHDGLDIGAPYGSTIVATADGMVTFVGYLSGYGWTVTINHGYGFETSYCHNSGILVKVGQKVTKGQPIAKVGNSGRSTGPHVHYMVKVNGVPKNPEDFLN